MSLASKIQTIVSLDPADRGVVWRAIIGLPSIALALRLISLGRVQMWLSKSFPADRMAGPERLAQVVSLLEKTETSHPYRANCLERSLALWWLLGREGIPADVRFGVRPNESGAPDFHAWLESEGDVLNDHPGIADEFFPFQGPIRPQRQNLV